ncbi:MAG: hypothetical protein DI544_13515 [Sphingomonas taxi]|uniref:Uncharacterized protein n=1 Tax=Sphingomonas taxi TaxID=1549858 RepID=A0A2W5QLK3_9SPHN|nr:MAG: hypothetical protein DI544_13515 [Sphingomonas taxi]
MSAAARTGAAAAVAAIERSADEDAFHDTVRAFAAPLGCDRFVTYTASPPGGGAVTPYECIAMSWTSGRDRSI